jgi:hypothetical protein
MAAIDISRARSSPPSRRDSVPPPSPLVRIAADGFVPDATVDGWTRSGIATRAGALLTLRDGRRYVLRDAIRVIGRRNGDTDPYGFTGRVEALRELIRRGVTLSADALRLGPAVYDIEYGAIASPCDR